tara:strand:+ start:375 stop:833 length:459 start_codon:yes stop_codon:yes gene_type:complete
MPYKDKEKANEKQREWYEKNKEKKKEYRQNNKEKIAERQREYYENNKEQINKQKKEYYENNKEKRAEDDKIYRQTPAGKKSRMMSCWRKRGVNNVNEEMYNHYIATTHCECCSKEFSSSRDRHLDHDHETGEYRWVLCWSCNNKDNWKKVVG